MAHPCAELVLVVSVRELLKFGFKFGRSGVHSSRTIMLEEVHSLFSTTQQTTTLEQFQAEIVDYNCLDNSTENTRKLTFRHLKGLYGLDDQLTLFRVFRQLWDIESDAQAILALQLAFARDPFFWMSRVCILAHKPG